jgi:hypothetical protein
MGNAARFVNDYRGIGGAPNAEFKLGRGEGGELRMEIWALKGTRCWSVTARVGGVLGKGRRASMAIGWTSLADKAEA